MLRTVESLPPEDILEACRAAQVYLCYFRESGALAINGDAGKVACVVFDVLRSEEKIKALMVELGIFDSLGSPLTDLGSSSDNVLNADLAANSM